MPHNLSLGDDLLPYSRVFTKAKATYACSVKKGESVNAVKMAIPEKDKTKKPTGQTTAVKNPARTRPTRAVSTTKPLKSCSPIKIAPPVSTKKVKSSAATSADKFSTDAGSSLQAAPRDAVLNREIAKAQKRANAREKEADALRTRVQELEPEVRRLERELEKRRTERCAPLLSPRSRTANQQQAGANSNSPQRMTGVREDDAALRGRVEAAEKRAKVLQLRCDQLELEKSLPLAQVAPPQQNIAISLTGDTVVTGMLSTEEKTKGKNEAKEDGGRGGQQEQAEAKRVKQQLEVAERRMKNSLYINEAHESLAALATAREREANARAAESERRLNRALEKLESIERRDTIAGLRASCVRDEEAIHMTERELRAHQLDPEFYLPVNTAKRRQLARSEQRLQRLRLRHASQSAALVQTELVERLHSDLRMAAGSGDVAATGKILEAAGGLSVNVPDETSLSAFLYACGQANPELVKVLLEAGGDVLDGDGRITGLIVAARKVNNTSFFRYCCYDHRPRTQASWGVSTTYRILQTRPKWGFNLLPARFGSLMIVNPVARYKVSQKTTAICIIEASSQNKIRARSRVVTLPTNTCDQIHVERVKFTASKYPPVSSVTLVLAALHANPPKRARSTPSKPCWKPGRTFPRAIPPGAPPSMPLLSADT